GPPAVPAPLGSARSLRGSRETRDARRLLAGPDVASPNFPALVDSEWLHACSRHMGEDDSRGRMRRFAEMTKRMAAAIAGLGLLATTMAACSTVAGACLGAGAGAAIGPGTGYGAGKGALLGTCVGAAAGAIYGPTETQ